MAKKVVLTFLVLIVVSIISVLCYYGGLYNKEHPINNQSIRQYQVVVRVTGLSQNKLFNDPLAPYSGERFDEQFRLSSSLLGNGQTMALMAWQQKDKAYEHTLWPVARNQSFWIRVARPSFEKAVPPGTFLVVTAGIFIDIKPVGGGETICSAELVHFEDIDPSSGYWYAAQVDSLDCPLNQREDNRSVYLQRTAKPQDNGNLVPYLERPNPTKAAVQAPLEQESDDTDLETQPVRSNKINEKCLDGVFWVDLDCTETNQVIKNLNRSTFEVQ